MLGLGKYTLQAYGCSVNKDIYICESYQGL